MTCKIWERNTFMGKEYALIRCKGNGKDFINKTQTYRDAGWVVVPDRHYTWGKDGMVIRIERQEYPTLDEVVGELTKQGLIQKEKKSKRRR